MGPVIPVDPNDIGPVIPVDPKSIGPVRVTGLGERLLGAGRERGTLIDDGIDGADGIGIDGIDGADGIGIDGIDGADGIDSIGCVGIDGADCIDGVGTVGDGAETDILTTGEEFSIFSL